MPCPVDSLAGRLGRSLSLTGMLLCLAAPAAAHGPLDAAVDWGLPGTWARDCAGPPSDGVGARTSFALRQGQLYQERDQGGPAGSSSLVTAVRIGDGGRLEMVIAAPHRNIHQILIKSDGRVRIWSTRDANTGEELVKDGRTRSGPETPWLARCR